MGMFDYVSCKMGLPESKNKSVTGMFQTKCLNNAMDVFTIEENGELTCGGHHEPITGDIFFYDFSKRCVVDGIPKISGWIEYVAEVKCGEVISIEVVEDR